MKYKNIIYNIVGCVFLVIAGILFGNFIFNKAFYLNSGESSNLFNFFGSLVGSIISLGVSLYIFHRTMNENNKQHINAINEQSAIQVENSLREKYSNEKKILNESYCSLEQYIYTSMNFCIDENNYSDIITKLNDNYSNYKKCVNTILIEMNILSLNELCIGCTLCENRLYGDLVRELKQIQLILKQIDDYTQKINYKQNIIFNLASDYQRKCKDENLMNNIINNLKTQQSLIKNSQGTEDNVLAQNIVSYINEIEKLRLEKKDIIQKISVERRYIDNKLNKLDKLKLDYFSEIKKYLELTSGYIKNEIKFVRKNGRMNNNYCKKLDITESETKDSK